MRRLITLPYAFVLLNWAAVAGLYYFITGEEDVWSKNKSVHKHRS